MLAGAKPEFLLWGEHSAKKLLTKPLKIFWKIYIKLEQKFKKVSKIFQNFLVKFKKFF